MVIPEQSGPLSLNITIEYTDDFNQPRMITRALEIEVMEGFEEPGLDPSIQGGGGGGGEVFPVPAEENALQKVWRFVLGLLGLDSASPSPSGNDPGIVPGPGGEEPLPAPQPGAGKG
jgi:hypothetical protein